MSTHPEENYEDVSVYDLDADVEEELLLAHNECTFIWANKEGWPVGVIMSYVWRKGRFWLTASSQRARISAVQRIGFDGRKMGEATAAWLADNT